MQHNVVGCGSEHSICIDSDLNIWEFGSIINGSSSGISSTPRIIENCNFTPISVCAGNGVSIVLDDNRKIWVWGRIGGSFYSTPTIIDNIPSIEFIQCCLKTLFLIDENKYLWCFGGIYGKLYDKPSKLDINIPVEIVSSGFNHVVFTDFNTLWGIGSNSSGQLGFDDISVSKTPIQLNINDSIINIACGANHTICHGNKHIYGFGEATYGQLAVKGDKIKTPIVINVPVEVSKIACGYHRSFFIDIDNYLYGCGANNWGQLGNNNTQKNMDICKLVPFPILYISNGARHSIITDIERNTYVMGKNYQGQLGLGNTSRVNTPVKVEQTHPLYSALLCINRSRQKSARK